MNKKKVYILGGGTFSHVRTHFALSTPAFGTTAKILKKLCESHSDKLDVELQLTKMADSDSSIITNEDVKIFVDKIVNDLSTKIVFFNVAITDFKVKTISSRNSDFEESTAIGKNAPRLKTSDGEHYLTVIPEEKIVKSIRQKRKDIFLVAFKTTSGATEDEQYKLGLKLLKEASCNLVLANDTITRRNMIITPEEARYHVTSDREDVLQSLVEMAYLRSHLTFTRSTIISGDSVPWNDERVPSSLRSVVDYCVEKGAYKQFLGATVGHFAAKLSDTTFLTSKRKTNFNDIKRQGLVFVKSDGPDSVIAYGSKPSVGGQSQRIVFSEHEGYDCIVHFHCPKLESSVVTSVSQREYECGSHECGSNTSRGLKQFGNLLAVYLDEHGPNIVFKRDIDPAEVIEFINANFDLSKKTGGYV